MALHRTRHPNPRYLGGALRTLTRRGATAPGDGWQLPAALTPEPASLTRGGRATEASGPDLEPEGPGRCTQRECHHPPAGLQPELAPAGS